MDKPPSINEIEIVPLDVTHIKEIAQLEEKCFPDPWSEDMFLVKLAHLYCSFRVEILKTIDKALRLRNILYYISVNFASAF